MRIAVIGAGVSGLVVARRLHAHHDVTVFEAGDEPGGHSRTLDVSRGGRTFAVDTGFVVFNDRTYPEFLRILDDLRVPTQRSEMSFSVRCDRTGIEYSGASLNAVFAQRRNLARPTFLRLVRDYLRFNRQAPKLLEADGRLTLDDYLEGADFSRVFRELYLVPMGAAIWSTDPARFGQMPIRSFVRFFHNHGLLGIRGKPQWYSITGGAREYVQALARPFRDRIHTRAPVTRVRRADDHVDVTVAGGHVAQFDQVVLATHSDQALRLLADPSPEERAVLGAIDYQANSVVMHTDTSLLPRRRRAWAAWNYYIAPDGGGRVATTYNMNRLQRLDAPETFCVTLNQDERIDDAAVIARMTYHHPTLNRAAFAAQRRWSEVNGRRRTWYAGAYWGYGFHEDGVVSGLRVARAIEAGA
ncbi:MAG: FAD-dependent oxidoreductase [Chloroflexi bacterium]|nr:FAD-dependent oxidoreductase [Chloroflexota bacterium]